MLFYGLALSAYFATGLATPVRLNPGIAKLDDARIASNECNIQVKPGELAFLVSPLSDFVKAEPGSSAAENGMCGRLDGDVIHMNNAGTILKDLTGFGVAPVGFCNECGPNDVIVNRRIFDILGGDPSIGIIENIFSTIA